MKGIERLKKMIYGYQYTIGLMVLMGVFIYIFSDKSGILLLRFDDIIIEEDVEMKEKSILENCDLFNGSWVYDNISRPLYKEKECSFLDDVSSCEKFGRKDFDYQFWRWQPYGCDLPRFNGIKLLEKLRNKKVVFVGDSIGKSQWNSLICLIDPWIVEPSHKVSEWHGSLITFRAFEYNVSIDFYWEPLLVESNCDDPVKPCKRDRIMKIKSIEKHAKQWSNADLLIFYSYSWWLLPNMTLLWGSFENPNKTFVESRRVNRYGMALKTWSNWLITHLNREKTRIFFISLSPDHHWGGDWGKLGGTCFNETGPIIQQGYWGKGSDTDLMRTAESAVQDLKTKGLTIELLNITQLSQYRKDGHPSIYKRNWEPPTELELANPILYSDCVHWCLPGVPDVWNEIFYSYIRYNI